MSKGQMLKEKIDHENGKERKHEKDYLWPSVLISG